MGRDSVGAAMLFTSHESLLLALPLAVVVFHGLARLGLARAALYWLLLVSLAWYAAAEPRWLPLLLGSALLNWALGRRLLRRPSAWLLAAGIGLDLALLALLRHGSPLLARADAWLGTSLATLGPPLGISFFTLLQLPWLIDAYRGAAPAHCARDYCLFVSFLPHVPAGPISHHEEVLPELQAAPRPALDPGLLSRGLLLIGCGLVKKSLLADRIAERVGPAFDLGAPLTALEAWGATVGYAFQVYFDFSGYTDLALGIALLFHVRLPANFDAPYRAQDVVEFWRRWHITLSTFLAAYVHLPLALWVERRRLPLRWATLVVTMLVAGLWHGVGWTFLTWGGLHGLYLVVNHAWRARGRPLPALAARGLTFLAVALAWVPFRAPSLEHAGGVLRGLVGLDGLAPSGGPLASPAWLAGLLALLISVDVLPTSGALAARMRPTWGWTIVTLALLLLGLSGLGRVSEFIYVQF